jgi:hypothetical protein
MPRKPRYRTEHTARGYVVLDDLLNQRVRGPFDGPTGKQTAAEHRDKLERENDRKRTQGGAR